MGMRGLLRPLKDVARGRWWVSRDCCNDGGVAPFLSTSTFSCTYIDHTHDAAEALVLENDEVPLCEHLRGRAKAVCRCSTERRHRASRGPPMEDWSIWKEQRGFATRRVFDVKRWRMHHTKRRKQHASSLRSRATIAKTVQPCHRGRRLLHPLRRI